MARRSRWLMSATLAFANLAAWGCKDGTHPNPCVTMRVTSPIGLRLGVGRTAQLTDSVLDGSGSSLSGLIVNWQSTAPGIADVSTTGLVTGRAEGSATIMALACGLSGSVTERVLKVAFDTARGTLTDPFVSALEAAMSAAPRGRIQQSVALILSGIDTGNFDTMQSGVDSAQSAVTGASDSTDKALGATLALFVDEASRLLRLQ